MNAYIFHGSTPHATADKFWYQNLADALNAQGIDAQVVSLPKLSRETLAESMDALEKLNLNLNKDTLLIGHSAGSNIILSLLESADVMVSKVLLVAGFSLPTTMPEPTLQETYDWETIRKHAKTFYFINAINDPFNCGDAQGKVLFDHLGGTLILDNGGHYTKSSYPLFLKLLMP